MAQYGKPISYVDFKTLRDYANEHKIRLSGFKDFVGDVETIKTVIDDIAEIAADFPLILDEKYGIWLELDYGLGTDFATTESGHVIHLNAVYFANIEELSETYDGSVLEGRFVKGTNWRAIARHETGHVVAYLYHVDSMKVAMQVLNTERKAEVRFRVGEELSLYAAEYEDGREIISESFSGYYSKAGNQMANDFVKHCLKIIKVGEGE